MKLVDTSSDSIHSLAAELTVTVTASPILWLPCCTKDNLWGKWVADQGQHWSAAQLEQWRYERQQIKEKRSLAEAQRRADSLSPVARDQHYRHLLNQLSLHPADRQDLERRGFTAAQIQASGFKSVVQWQPLASDLPHTLPGVSLAGRSLNVPGAGYLCPLQDAAGLIVGLQLRLRDSAEGGRYRWLTSATKKRPHGPTPHLPNGELPLAVHRPDAVQRPAIALVKGTGAKPFLLAQRQGQITIGAAGGQFASSPQTLQATLTGLTAALGTHVIEFYPDAGASGNHHVMRQYRATWKSLRQWGYTVQVAWWGQETKAAPDIDELDDPSAIAWLTTAQMEAMAHPRATWLEQIQRRLQRALQPTSAAALQRMLTGPEPAVREYLAGTRHATWQQAVSQGYRYLLDQSATGTGKSFEAGLLEPSLLGVRQLMYVSDQHRNPTLNSPPVETRGILSGCCYVG